MLLSPSYKTIELSTLVDNKKEYKMSFNIYNICILCTPIIALFSTKINPFGKKTGGEHSQPRSGQNKVKANF